MPKIVLFTGTALRHHAMASVLNNLGDVTMIAERPLVAMPRPPALTEYFRRMSLAEREVFGGASGVGQFRLITRGGLSMLTDGDLPKADVVVVFGAPWIRPPLLDWCLSRRAINLHAGVAPEYRGTACNFWAQYDQSPELVGYTVHYLDQGLDTGAILERMPSEPRPAHDPWFHSMRALRRGVLRVGDLVRTAMASGWPIGQTQDPSRLIRYSKAAEFTEQVAAEYLERTTGWLTPLVTDAIDRDAG